MPDWLELTSKGKLHGTPENADVGLSYFTITVSDPSGSQDTATINLMVENQNDAPNIISTPPNKIYQNDFYQYQITAEDVDALVVDENLYFLV